MAAIPPEMRNAVRQFKQDACGPDAVTTPLGDLDNPIHDLFARNSFSRIDYMPDGTEEFHVISEAAYKAIMPALRLASLLITEPKMLGPFDHVASGIVTADESGDTYIRNGGLEGTPEGVDFVKAIFESMVDRVRFYFADQNEYVNDGPTGTMEPFIWDLKDLSVSSGGQKYTRKVRDACARITFLARGHLQYLEHDMVHDRPGYQFNAMLRFTMLLMHELMHAFFVFAGNEYFALGSRHCEPRFARETRWHELGHEYENWMMGQLLMEHTSEGARSVGTALRTSSGVMADNFPTIFLLTGNSTAEQDPKNPDCMLLAKAPKSTMLTSRATQAWFLKQTWRHIRNEGHAFMIEQMNRSEIVYLCTDPEPGREKILLGIQLLYDGEPYLELGPCSTVSDTSADANDAPNPAIFVTPRKRKRDEVDEETLEDEDFLVEVLGVLELSETD